MESTTPERPTIQVSLESRGQGSVYNLSLGGIDHGATVKQEFTAIAVKHGVASGGGGCYMVNAVKLGGGRVEFLGGMYVAPDKRDAVVGELKSLGYKVEQG